MVRVIFTGTTGLRKSKAIGKVIDEVLQESGNKPDHDNIQSRKFIRYFNFEEELRKKYKTSLWTYLTTGIHENKQREMWNDTFDSIMTTINKEKPKHVFISLHATFFQSSRFFSVLNQAQLTRFKPDLFITLIDDIYSAWQRIVSKSESGEDKGKSYLRLRDILAWRAVELLVTDLIANYLEKKNFMLSVKHPPKMLFNLIFHPEKMFVYASYPISKTRTDRNKRQEIDDFRYELHKDHVVFDPLTIDEKIMGFAAKGKTSEKVKLAKEARWPIPKNHTMVYDDDLDFPLELDRLEIEDVEEDIDNYVQARDYRLVSQADALVAYRPYYGGEPHRGVNSEINFATQTLRERYFYVPQVDDKKGKSPFKDSGRTFLELEELYEALKKISPEEQRNWKEL